MPLATPSAATLNTVRRFMLVVLAIGIVPLGACVGGIVLSEGLKFQVDGAVEVRAVTEEGHLQLDDGRRVRIFGIRPPEDPDQRAAFTRAIMQASSDLGVTVDTVIIPGEVPAVGLTAWYSTWSGHPGRSTRRLNSASGWSIIDFVDDVPGIELDETDLSDSRASTALIEDLRRRFER